MNKTERLSWNIVYCHALFHSLLKSN